MGVQVRERDIDEMKEKLNTMNTALNKISYLDSALKETGFSFEIKRFLHESLSELYAERKMYDRAAKAMSNKAAMEVTHKDKVDSYITAAELYSQAGRVEDAEQMFISASRDVDEQNKQKVKLARKNIYYKMAHELEQKGKKATAAKFYEKIIKMKLDEEEKEEIKNKLIKTYKALGLFRESRLIEGI